jgi:hypothetical protein
VFQEPFGYEVTHRIFKGGNRGIHGRHPTGSPRQIIIEYFKRYALRNSLLNRRRLEHLRLSSHTVERFLGQESAEDERVELVWHVFKEDAWLSSQK